MTPDFFEIIYGRTAFVKRKAPFKLLFIVWSQSSSDVSINFLLNATPALFTSMSIVLLPNFSIANLTSELTWEDAYITLYTQYIRITCQLNDLFYSSINFTLSPGGNNYIDSLFANITTVSFPIPLPLPVIIAVFLCSCFILLLVDTLYLYS